MNINRIFAIILRHLYNFKHHVDRWSDCFFWPAMDIVLWGLTSQYIQNTGASLNNIVLVLLSGLVFWQVIWRGQYEIATNFLEELWSKNLVNIFSTPLSSGEWIMGVIMFGLIKMFISISFAILLVWLFYTINILSIGFLLIPFFASLLFMGWWVGLIVAGVLVSFGRQVQTAAWIGVYLLAPFSAIYYPVSSLPKWGQIVARFLPSSYVFEGMRKALTLKTVPLDELLISFALNFIYLIFAYFFFKWCFKKSKEKGLARLEF